MGPREAKAGSYEQAEYHGVWRESNLVFAEGVIMVELVTPRYGSTSGIQELIF